MKFRKFTLVLLFLLIATITMAHQYAPDIIVTKTGGLWTDTRAYTSLANALTAIGGNERTLYIVRQEDYTGDIPATTSLNFMRVGSINATGAVTINTKSIIAGNRRIFFGAGALTFADGSFLKSAWFEDIDEAIAETNNDTVTILITQSDTAADTQAVGNDVTLLWQSPGNIISITGIVSNISSIIAGDYEIITGAGRADFNDGMIVKSTWFDQLRTVGRHIDNSEVILKIRKSETLDYSYTFARNITLDFIRGNILTVADGQTLTIDGAINAGIYQIFNEVGTGAIVLGGILIVDWWGNNTTPGTTDMSDVIDSAADAAPTDGSIISTLVTSGETYLLSSAVTITNRYLNVDIRGLFKSDDISGPMLTITPDTGTIKGRFFNLRGERATLNWTNGTGVNPEDGTWDVANPAFKLEHFWHSKVRVSAKNFDAALHLLDESGGIAYNNIDVYQSFNNQVGIYAEAITGGYINANVFTLFIQMGSTIERDKPRYGVVAMEMINFNDNTFYGNVELKDGDYDGFLTEDNAAVVGSGRFYANNFYFRAEDTETSMHLLNGSVGTGVNRPHDNRYYKGAGDNSTLNDETEWQSSYVAGFRGPREVGSRFTQPLLINSNIYKLSRTVDTNKIQVNGRFLGPTGAVTRFRDYTTFTIDTANEGIVIPVNRLIGVRISGLDGDEEFLVKVHSPTDHAGRLVVRAFTSGDAEVTNNDSVVGDPAGVMNYSGTVPGHMSGSDNTQYTKIVRLNDATISYIEILIRGGSDDDAVIDTFQIYIPWNQELPVISLPYGGMEELGGGVLYSDHIPEGTDNYNDGQIVFKTNIAVAANRIKLGWVYDLGTTTWQEIWVSDQTW